MKTSTLVTMVALTALGFAAPMTAGAAGFTNGSFETVAGGSNPAPGTFNTLFAGNTDITGWLVAAGNVDLVNGNYFAPDFIASDGQNSVDLNGSTQGTITQTFDTIAGTQYRVTFDLNSNVYDGNPNAIKNVLASAAGFSGVFGYPNALHPQGLGGPWQSHMFDFIATGASTTLSFQSLEASNCCYGAELDNVAVNPFAGGVPEPAAWMLMMVGFGGLGSVLRRRRAGLSVALARL